MADAHGPPIFRSQTPGEAISPIPAAIHVGRAGDPAEPPAVKRERWKLIQRRVWAVDGREGLELIEEREVVYAPAQGGRPSATDPVRIALAGTVAFIIVALTFTAAGGSDQSFALAPFYWGFFCFLWWLLA